MLAAFATLTARSEPFFEGKCAPGHWVGLSPITKARYLPEGRIHILTPRDRNFCWYSQPHCCFGNCVCDIGCDSQFYGYDHQPMNDPKDDAFCVFPANMGLYGLLQIIGYVSLTTVLLLLLLPWLGISLIAIALDFVHRRGLDDGFATAVDGFAEVCDKYDANGYPVVAAFLCTFFGGAALTLVLVGPRFALLLAVLLGLFLYCTFMKMKDFKFLNRFKKEMTDRKKAQPARRRSSPARRSSPKLTGASKSRPQRTPAQRTF